MPYFVSLVELWKTDGRGLIVQSCKFPGNPDYVTSTIPFTKRPVATEDQNNAEEPSQQAKTEQVLKWRR